MNKPLVSICCLAYNHEKYISECLNGFMMQKTNFELEILIHDDASTDNTANIIREYELKYPNIVKPIYQTENQYSQGIGVTRVYNFPRAQGKYIAMCEGDDYWTDPLKLQKQVEFLEKNEDYSMCFTNAKVKNEIGISNHYTVLYDHLKDKDYTGKEIYEKWTIPTASILFRNTNLLNLPLDKRFVAGDIVLFLWLAQHGKIKCINEEMVVYRRNKGGVTFEKKSYTEFIAHHEAIKEHFGEDYYKTSDKLMTNIYVNSFLKGKLGNESVTVLKDLLKNPRFILPFLLKIPGNFNRSMVNKIKIKS